MLCYFFPELISTNPLNVVKFNQVYLSSLTMYNVLCRMSKTQISQISLNKIFQQRITKSKSSPIPNQPIALLTLFFTM